jgi:protein tyrosine phosphatase
MDGEYHIWSSGLTTSCDHWHQKVAVGEHFVWASRLLAEKSDDFYPDAAVYLDPAWAERTKLDFERYLLVEWPDYGTVELDQLRFALQWTNQWIDQGKCLEVGCMGGHGRTGTFLACLLVDREGLGAEEAIQTVRSRYCHEAVETVGQEQMVRQYAVEGPSTWRNGSPSP